MSVQLESRFPSRISVVLRGGRKRPALALLLIVLASLLARAAWLDAPCRAPCRAASDHVLVFDEIYYVNAARRIAGVTVPSGSPYAGTPAGRDPNSEHPQLVKLLIAGGIELLGDGPLAWRWVSLLLGSVALLGLYALARAAGAGRGVATAASALMAADNLLLVHGRIATLDVPVLAAMLCGTTLYLRGRPALGGAVLGVGACCKLVAPYTLIALALFEVLSRARPRAALARLLAAASAGAAVFLALTAAMDRIAPPYDPNAHRLVGGGVLGHVSHMLQFASAQVSRGGPRGIASYPWGWWVDYKPIVYLNIDAHRPSPGLAGVHPDVHFLGVISPPVLLLALPALWIAARRRDRPGALALAWCAGTWLPFLLASLLAQRTSYLYYMVVVMPGAYLAVARLLCSARFPRRAARAMIAAVVLALVLMYPLTPLPG